jgi:hypothetical protein
MTVIVKPKAIQEPELVASGAYEAELVEVKQFSNAFGSRIGFVFEIVGGEYDGVQLMRSCSPTLTKQSKLTEIIKGILKREPTEMEMTKGFDLDSLVETTCHILVMTEQAKNGKTFSNIERVF